MQGAVMTRRCFGIVASFAFAMAAPAFAADMPVKAPLSRAPPPIAVYNWTGCYVGGHIGGGWGRKRWVDPSDFTDVFFFTGSSDLDSHKVSGVLGGAQIGCNFQTSRLVPGP
jgi:outer membrane immunogenic protein